MPPDKQTKRTTINVKVISCNYDQYIYLHTYAKIKRNIVKQTRSTVLFITLEGELQWLADK